MFGGFGLFDRFPLGQPDISVIMDTVIIGQYIRAVVVGDIIDHGVHMEPVIPGHAAMDQVRHGVGYFPPIDPGGDEIVGAGGPINDLIGQGKSPLIGFGVGYGVGELDIPAGPGKKDVEAVFGNQFPHRGDEVGG